MRLLARTVPVMIILGLLLSGCPSTNNTAPVVSIVEAAHEVVVAETSTLHAHCADPDDDPLTISWLVDGQVVAGETAMSFDFVVPAVGEHIVSVVASDGLETATDSVVITGVAEPEPEPEIQAVRVAITGSDANTGGATDPVRTISHALVLADTHDLPVFLAAGTYMESVSLTSGVTIHGGYDPVTWDRDIAANAAIISGGTSAVSGSAIADVTIDGVTIVSADATVAGDSSYGVFLVNSTGVELANCTILSGAGADGAAGVGGAGGEPGEPGEAGEAGGDFTLSTGYGGLGGYSFTNPEIYPGGTGGNGGFGDESGESGDTGYGTGGGAGGLGGALYFSGSPGEDGQAGASGFDGIAGSNFGTATMAGYLSPAGSEGADGDTGSGGGGGGGGSGIADSWDDYYGGGGGGGGSSGAPGTRGTGGSGGGGSFAVWVYGSSNLVLDNCVIQPSTGGPGGAGGAGGSGGTGGSGGHGGTGGNGSGSGGAGGDGGTGGDGGHGGGGGGGPAIGIVAAGGAVVTQLSNVFVPGTGGTGGASQGNPGSNGLVQDVY